MPDQPSPTSAAPSPADGIPSPIIDRPPTPGRQPQMDAVLDFFRTPSALSSYGHVVRASILAQGMGMFVVAATTSKNYDLAIKMNSHIHPSERDTADFAAQATNQVLTGRMYERHRVFVNDPAQPWEADIMIGDRVPGETVATVWERLGWLERRSFKKDMTTELAAQVARMRALKQPFIGRVTGSDGPPQETRNLYDGPVGGYFGPFTGPDPEAAFDEWAISQLPDPAEQASWRVKLEKDRQKRRSSSKPGFVLTHADLTSNNIMVAKDDTSGKYRITGLIDWDRSAFLPEYAEHVVLSAVSFHDKEWLKVLKDAVPRGDCSSDRLEFTRVLQGACNPMAGGFSMGVMGKW